MSPSLPSLRKAKGFTQEELAKAIAKRLGQPIGASYAQKKMARFEAGTASPTPQEIFAMAEELGVEVEVLESLVTIRAPFDAVSTVDQISASVAENGRALIASCTLSRARPQSLDDSLAAAKRAVEDNNVSIAVFVPYPISANVPEPSEHISNLIGQYVRVRKTVSDANLIFKNSLSPARADAVALYFPRAELLKTSAILIPPVFRQFSITFNVAPSGVVTKELNMWTPGAETDNSRPVKATGVYSLEEQIDAWEAFFGGVAAHWITNDEFTAEDPYWERIR